MNLELNPDETELLRKLLLAEIEEKQVEVHHAKNVDYKTELLAEEKLVNGILKRLG